MRRRTASTLGAALLCGGLAGYLALGTLRAEAGVERAPPTVDALQVVVAARDLPGERCSAPRTSLSFPGRECRCPPASCAPPTRWWATVSSLPSIPTSRS